MRGLIVECEDDKEFAIVDTRSDQHGRLRLYHGEPAGTLTAGMTVDFELKVSGAGNTYAKLTSVIERNQAPFSTEDRARWYEWGEDAEADFVEKIVPQLGLDIRKNPEKERCSWAIDLFDYTNNRPADLKVQNTPFFTVVKYRYCGKRCDPAYSVTLNRKDFENYQANHPDCFIYFWVHWTQREYRGITVPELYGVWQAELSKLGERIQRGEAPLHAYQNRQTDDHNARDSYVFSLLDEDVFERLL